ncbi:MAG: T9SS type A sorting domain-containing protein [bacterium]|nr:T9SS type A sorting domain-containing protein [bacterium]
MHKIKIIKVLGIIFLFSGLVYARTTMSVGSGSYYKYYLNDSELDSNTGGEGFRGTLYKEENITEALPSNTWWASLLFTQFSNQMYAFPFCFQAQTDGLILGINDNSATSTRISYPFTSHLRVGADSLAVSSVTLAGFTDWSVDAKWNGAFTATMGQGFAFTYFEYESGIDPIITASENLTFNANGSNQNFTIITSDGHYFGVFLPDDATVTFHSSSATITLPESNSKFSIGAMTSASDISTFETYAYNVITNTEVSWDINSTTQEVTTTYDITTDTGGDTLILLLPHHYNNGASSNMTQTFNSIRGPLKMTQTKSFSTELNFNGIIPFFEVSMTTTSTTTLNSYLLLEDHEIEGEDLYFDGKKATMLANLLKIAEDIPGDSTPDLEILIKNFLTDLLSVGGDSELYYNSNINSLIAYPHSYGNENLNDHHFHYGYYIYAAAILAHFDSTFKTNYADMIELLIKDIADPVRGNTDYPFLRNMEIYEGHSIANGMAIDSPQSTQGPDQESSSEAMNAWAAIYLWGLITENDTYRDLGIWGYTTEYSSIQEYWQNKNNIYNWNHTSIGQVFGSDVTYNTWFSASPTYIYGIQILPINPSSFYLAYDTDYLLTNNTQLINEEGVDLKNWEDLFTAYSLLNDYTLEIDVEDSNYEYTETTKAFLYYWSTTLKKFGQYVGHNYYSNEPSYAVFTKGGIVSYFCFNPSSADKDFILKHKDSPEVAFKATVSAGTLAVHRLASYTINDGIGADIDEQVSNTSLSANWDDPFKDDVTSYRYSVRYSSSEVGSADIAGWTNIGSNTSFTKNDFTNLLDNTRYIIDIEASSNSDGQLIFSSDGVYINMEKPTTIITFYDGLESLDIDYTESTNTLSAQWAFPGTEEEKASYTYLYAISTSTYSSPLEAISQLSSLETAKTTWTSTTNTSMTIIDPLTNGLKYYIYIRAIMPNGATTLPHKTDGIIAAFEKPEVTLTLKRGGVTLSSPLTSGLFVANLLIDSDGIPLNTPTLEYTFGASTTRQTISLDHSNDLWFGSAYIKSERDSDYITFYVTAEDKAGNIATTITGTSSFTIKNTFLSTEETIITAEDGSAIKIDANTVEGVIQGEILSEDASDPDILKANNKISNSTMQNFAVNHGIYKDFNVYVNGTNQETFPNQPITIYISYATLDSNADRIIDLPASDGNKYAIADLALFHYNGATWEHVQETEIEISEQRLFAEVDSLSLYAVLLARPTLGIENMIVYPTPYYSDKHDAIKIGNLPTDYTDIEVKVYDISGKEIIAFDGTDVTQNFTNNYIEWDAKERNGDSLATGVYIVLVKYHDVHKIQKIAIIQ